MSITFVKFRLEEILKMSSSRTKILLIVDSPGPADSFSVFLPRLAKIAEVKVLALAKAYPILKNFGAEEVATGEQIAAVVDLFKPEIFLPAISSLVQGPYLLNDSVKLAKAKSIPVFLFQDFWSNHRHPSNFAMMSFWDAVATVDNLAADLLKDDKYQGQIFVTGNPAYDKFFHGEFETKRKQARKKLGIPDDRKLVLYVGQGSATNLFSDVPTFKLLCEALELLKDPVLLSVRPHPRSESIEHYQKFSADLEMVHTPEFFLTDELLPAADLVISMYASNLVHASILGVPTISILLPGAGRKALELCRLDDFPLNNGKGTLGFYENSAEKLAETISEVLKGKIKQTHPDFKSGAADRLASAVKIFTEGL